MLHKFDRGISPAELKEFITKYRVCAVYIYTSWCSSCKRIGPIFEKVSEEFPELCFLYVNLGDSRWINQKFNIHSIPYLLFIKNQKLTNKVRFDGTKGHLIELIKKELK